MGVKHYDWDATFSRQTGSQGEFCIVAGAKSIGKTFGLRLKCINEYIKKGFRFVEISRTKAERDEIMNGYYDKLQHDGFFKDYVFKTEKDCGYIARKPPEGEKPEWELITYFVALTAFQVEKRRTFTGMKRFIFDEAAIDKKDKYHRYLPNEFFILANLLDSIGREQPDATPFFRVYLLMNAVDLTCPYLRHLGITKPPEYGYSFYNDKHTLLHYVEPWDAEQRKANTLVGRMLAGSDESKIMFDNAFHVQGDKEICKKTSNAKYTFGLVFQAAKYGIWLDHKSGIWYINEHIPKGSKAVFALTKHDNTIDYQAVKRTDEYMQLIVNAYYAGAVRYSNPYVRESFLDVLGFLGVK